MEFVVSVPIFILTDQISRTFPSVSQCGDYIVHAGKLSV